MTTHSAVESILRVVGAWPGVERTSAGHDTVLSVAGREFARVDLSGAVDVPTTRGLRNQLLTDGLADRHRVRPRSSWVTYRVRSPADAPGAVRLLRFAYLCRLFALSNRAARRGEPSTVFGVDADAELLCLGVSRDLTDLTLGTYRRLDPSRRDTPSRSASATS